MMRTLFKLLLILFLPLAGFSQTVNLKDSIENDLRYVLPPRPGQFQKTWLDAKLTGIYPDSTTLANNHTAASAGAGAMARTYTDVALWISDGTDWVRITGSGIGGDHTVNGSIALNEVILGYDGNEIKSDPNFTYNPTNQQIVVPRYNFNSGVSGQNTATISASDRLNIDFQAISLLPGDSDGWIHIDTSVVFIYHTNNGTANNGRQVNFAQSGLLHYGDAFRTQTDYDNLYTDSTLVTKKYVDDAISSGANTFAGLIDVNLTSLAQYHGSFFNGTDWVNQLVGTNNISDLAITTGKLQSGAVTFAKFQLLPQFTLMGRNQSGNGQMEALAVGDFPLDTTPAGEGYLLGAEVEQYKLFEISALLNPTFSDETSTSLALDENDIPHPSNVLRLKSIPGGTANYTIDVGNKGDEIEGVITTSQTINFIQGASMTLYGASSVTGPNVYYHILWIANNEAIVSVQLGATPKVIAVAVGDESTSITTGTGKIEFPMPTAATITNVRAYSRTAPTGSGITIDINENGTSILSTKLTIDATEKVSTTAATPPVISDTSIADFALMSVDFDAVGSTVAGAGVKVFLYYTQ